MDFSVRVKMKKIRSYTTFFAKNGKDFVLKNIKPESEVEFPSRSVKQTLCINDDAGEVDFDLIYANRSEVREFLLREGSFLSSQDLYDLSIEFSLSIKPDPLLPISKIAYLASVSTEYSGPCFGVIRHFLNRFFLVIFDKRGITNFEDNIVYVHGIWEVELSKEFSDRLFPGK